MAVAVDFRHFRQPIRVRISFAGLSRLQPNTQRPCWPHMTCSSGCTKRACLIY